MKSIWKFPLELGKNRISAPWSIQGPYHVAFQNGKICLWAEVNPNSQEPWAKTFLIVGTGEQYDATNLTYIQTVHVGTFVWHVFELRE